MNHRRTGTVAHGAIACGRRRRDSVPGLALLRLGPKSVRGCGGSQSTSEGGMSRPSFPWISRIRQRVPLSLAMKAVFHDRCDYWFILVSVVSSPESLLIQALYRLVVLQSASFTFTQEISMPPERRSHVSLKVFLKRPQPPVERNQVPPPFPGLVADNA